MIYPKIYYLMYSQGQGNGCEGPYSILSIKEFYIDCLGGMSVGIGKKDKKGNIKLLSKKKTQELTGIPDQLQKEYISACMKVNSLANQLQQYI